MSAIEDYQRAATNLAAVQKDGLRLHQIPVDERLPNICAAAVQQNWKAISAVPFYQYHSKYDTHDPTDHIFLDVFKRVGMEAFEFMEDAPNAYASKLAELFFKHSRDLPTSQKLLEHNAGLLNTLPQSTPQPVRQQLYNHVRDHVYTIDYNKVPLDLVTREFVVERLKRSNRPVKTTHPAFLQLTRDDWLSIVRANDRALELAPRSYLEDPEFIMQYLEGIKFNHYYLKSAMKNHKFTLGADVVALLEARAAEAGVAGVAGETVRDIRQIIAMVRGCSDAEVLEGTEAGFWQDLSAALSATISANHFATPTNSTPHVQCILCDGNLFSTIDVCTLVCTHSFHASCLFSRVHTTAAWQCPTCSAQLILN